MGMDSSRIGISQNMTDSLKAFRKDDALRKAMLTSSQYNCRQFGPAGA